jgi:hypothetical protein
VAVAVAGAVEHTQLAGVKVQLSHNRAVVAVAVRDLMLE